MKVALVAVALLLMSLAAESAEDPETIVKRMRDDAGECHYVLSICSDTVRAEAALAKLRSDPHTDPERLTAAEERVAKQVDLLTRAAAAVRKRHATPPDCFHHCERLEGTR